MKMKFHTLLSEIPSGEASIAIDVVGGKVVAASIQYSRNLSPHRARIINKPQRTHYSSRFHQWQEGQKQ